jgi:hypothetical protein
MYLQTTAQSDQQELPVFKNPLGFHVLLAPGTHPVIPGLAAMSDA